MGAAMQADHPDIEIQDRLTNHFGVLRIRADGAEYVDVIFEKGMALPLSGRSARVVRPVYDPRYNIGRFQYLECDEVGPESGEALGEPVYWNRILFPYDRELNPDGRLPELDEGRISSTETLRHERIQEEYFLDEFGIVTARISRTVQDEFSCRYNLFRRV